MTLNEQTTEVKLFEKIVREVAVDARPISTGWLNDAGFYFCGSEYFSKAAARINDDPLCQIEMHAALARDVENIHAVQSILLKIWQDFNTFQFSATAFCLYKQAAVLRFVSHSTSDSLSGRMVIGGEHYEELIWMNDAESKRIYPSLPFPCDFTTMALPDAIVRRPHYWPETLEKAEAYVAEARLLLAKIAALVSIGYEQFVLSEANIDAMRFNLNALHFATRSLRFKDFRLREWSRPLTRVGYQYRDPALISPAMLWELGRDHALLLNEYLNTYELLK